MTTQIVFKNFNLDIFPWLEENVGPEDVFTKQISKKDDNGAMCSWAIGEGWAVYVCGLAIDAAGNSLERSYGYVIEIDDPQKANLLTLKFC